MRNDRELGRLLRLIGPLIQLPSLWLLTQRPEWAARNMILIYSLFFTGLCMVAFGLYISQKGNKAKP